MADNNTKREKILIDEDQFFPSKHEEETPEEANVREERMVDYFGYAEKTVLVTGAASSIGRAACLMLMALGAEVHAVGHKKHIHLDAHQIYYLDFSNDAGMVELIGMLPKSMDAVFICHGVSSDFEDPLEQQKHNFLSVKMLAERLIPNMKKGGSITILSASDGFECAEDFPESHEVVKHRSYQQTVRWYKKHIEIYKADPLAFSRTCLNNYARFCYLDDRYRSNQIRLNAVCPGTMTIFPDPANSMLAITSFDVLLRGKGYGMLEHAEEVAPTMVAVGSDLFAYTSGQVIYCDHELIHLWKMEAYHKVYDQFRK